MATWGIVETKLNCFILFYIRFVLVDSMTRDALRANFNTSRPGQAFLGLTF